MELFLALAAVIVAGATLFFAVMARRRFDTHENRLRRAEQNVTTLESGQQTLADAAQAAKAAHQADVQRFQQLSKSIQKLAETHDSDQQAWQAIADVLKTVNQLRGELTAGLKDQGTQLDSLGQLADGHNSRHGSLDQVTATFQQSLSDLRADMAQLKEQADRHSTALRELRDHVTSSSGETREKLIDLDEQLLALAAELGQLDRDRQEVHAQLRKWLARVSQQASAAPAARIMPGFIQVERQAAAQILPCLYESLLRAADLDFVFREQTGPVGVFYYLVPCSSASQPEQQLGDLLSACPDPGVMLPGMTELRGLLRAMHAGGPGIVRVGPLIVGHGAAGTFSGTLLTAAEAEAIDAADPAASPGQYLSLLSELPGDRIVELAAWAATES